MTICLSVCLFVLLAGLRQYYWFDVVENKNQKMGLGPTEIY